MNRLVLAAVWGALVAGVPAWAQENGGDHEVAVQYLGSFQKETTRNGVVHDTSNSYGALATYRYFFNRFHGVETNYGYTLNTQRYSLGGVTSGLKTHAHEATAAYVFRAPMRKWTPFGLAGAGAVVFAADPSGFDLLARPAFVYGGGANFGLGGGWFLRAQYRGLVYNSPVIGATTVATERVTHQAQPSIGIGWTF
jgi:opacity protein-like surface antigen